MIRDGSFSHIHIYLFSWGCRIRIGYLVSWFNISFRFLLEPWLLYYRWLLWYLIIRLLNQIFLFVHFWYSPYCRINLNNLSWLDLSLLRPRLNNEYQLFLRALGHYLFETIYCRRVLRLKYQYDLHEWLFESGSSERIGELVTE